MCFFIPSFFTSIFVIGAAILPAIGTGLAVGLAAFIVIIIFKSLFSSKKTETSTPHPITDSNKTYQLPDEEFDMTKEVVENKKELEQEETKVPIYKDEFKIAYFVIAAMVLVVFVLFSYTDKEPKRIYLEHESTATTEEKVEDVKPEIKEAAENSKIQEIERQKAEKEAEELQRQEAEKRKLAIATIKNVRFQKGKFSVEPCKSEYGIGECLCESDINYPIVTGLVNEIEQAKLNKKLKAVAVENKCDGIFRKQWKKSEEEHNNSKINVSYALLFNTPDVLVISQDSYNYGSGAAHGISQGNTYIIDVKSGKNLSPSDIFGTNIPEVNRHTYNSLKKEELIFEDEVEKKKDKFLDTNTCNGCVLLPTKKGMKIIFDESGIAASAAGRMEIIIPANYISLDYLRNLILNIEPDKNLGVNESKSNATPNPSFESEERKKDRLETQKIFDDVKQQKEIHRLYEQQKESEREASDRIYNRTHKENTGSNQYERECLARGSDDNVCKSLGILYDKGYR